MRKLIFNLHLFVALAAGVFVFILGVTGSVMAFEPEIDNLRHWKMVYVTPQPPALPLARVQAAILKAFPGERIVAYGIPTSPDLSYQAVLGSRETVYVNPYTGAVLGRRAGQDWVDVLQNDIHQFHLRLLLRPRGPGKDPGKEIMSWAGVAALFLAISGLYLWWPLKRTRIESRGSRRRFWFDLHNVTGIFSLVFLLALAGTGVMIGFDEKTVPMFYKLTGSAPSRAPRVRADPPPGARPIPPEEALAIARAALPGAAPFFINVPGPRDAYQIPCRFPEDRTPGGRSLVLVDQYSGKVLYAQGSRTAPGGRRLEIANRAIHTGDLFGIPSKVVLSLASLMAPLQLISGALLWWTRRRREASPGKAARATGGS